MRNTAIKSKKQGKGGVSSSQAKDTKQRKPHGMLPQIGSMRDTSASPISSDAMGGVETKAKQPR